MMVKVSDERPFLYHYTTCHGLIGIVESQQIHATSIAYLNDSEEHTGYLQRRLPVLLKQWATEALSLRRTAVPIVLALTTNEIEEQAQEIASRLHAGIFELTARYDDPYVASFSTPSSENPEDGLLSQWRGYGQDGGYAIVFETSGIEQLLELENATYHHQALLIGDVDYHYDGSHEGDTPLPETIESEQQIREALLKFINTGRREDLETMYQPLMQLSVRSKHRGFKEEAEVRIVALRSIPEVWNAEKDNGEPRSQRELFFRPKNGLAIPYVKLFGTDKLGKGASLPIRQVIVGPHREKASRRNAVERLLSHNGIDANVTESSIPYLAN